MDSLEQLSNKSNWRSNADDADKQFGSNRKQLIIGPPSHYSGPRPPISCELYITNLPTSLDVMGFLRWLNRLGDVFEIRIMMKDSYCETRGFCFVRFFEKRAAIAAFELLSFLFLNGKRPNAQISLCKRQLFLCGIPKNLSITVVRETFKKLFGSVTKCVVYPQSEMGAGNGFLNRGFAFLEFNEHDAALEGKRFLRSHRLWGHPIKVDWARQVEGNESSLLTMKSFEGQRKNDYSAKLRLYAIANNWDIPIVVFGRNFKEHNVQYGGVLIKDARTGNYSCVVVEVIGPVFDVHILLCEIVTHLAEVYCGLPEKHFFVRARHGSIAKIMYSFTDMTRLREETSTIPSTFLSAWAAFDLMASLDILAQYAGEYILRCYKLSFRSDQAAIEHIARFALIGSEKLSHFFSVYPKYRDNYALNNNFNDAEIVLLQAAATATTSSEGVWVTPEEFNALLNVKTPDEGAFELKSQRYNRHPNYVLNFVDIQGLRTCGFYNSVQQFNTPPLWVCGETYQVSIFDLA